MELLVFQSNEVAGSQSHVTSVLLLDYSSTGLFKDSRFLNGDELIINCLDQSQSSNHHIIKNAQ